MERHFKDKVLQELYDLLEDDKRDPPVPPKEDKVLWEVFAKYRDMEQHPVVSYHEHDSLLENLPEEKLSVEERDEVWAEYLVAVDASTKLPPQPQSSQSNIIQPKLENSELPDIKNDNWNFTQAIDNNLISNNYQSAINMTKDYIDSASNTQPVYSNSINNIENYHASELTGDQNNNPALVNLNQAFDYQQYCDTAETSNVEYFPAPLNNDLYIDSLSTVDLPNGQNISSNPYLEPSQQMMNVQNSSSEPTSDDFFNALKQLDESSSVAPHDAQFDGTVGSDSKGYFHFVS